MSNTYVRPARRHRRPRVRQRDDRTSAARQSAAVPLERPARLDREAAYNVALTFHRLHLEAQLAGIQDVREHVTRAWAACYGTELQRWRYDYYVHHPDHAAVRVQCLNEIVDDGLERLLREDPRLNLQVIMNFAKGMIHEVLHDDRYLEISGCTVLHLQTPEGMKEERVLHRSPPAKLVKAFLDLIVAAVGAQVTLHVIANGAVGQAARAQGVSPSRVFAGLSDPRIGKARP